MTDKEVMQMALDVLIPAVDGEVYTSWAGYGWAAIEALRAELAQPEPDYEAEFIKDWDKGKVKRVSDGKRMVPEREWVGLTELEVSKIGGACFSLQQTAEALEQALKEKNGY